MSKRKIRLNKRGKSTLLALFMMIVFAFLVLYIQTRPLIVFQAKAIDVEIGTSFEPLEQIKKLRKGALEEIQIDTSEIDFAHLGSYEAAYTIDQHTYYLEVHIVDTTPPVFDVQTGSTDAKVALDPAKLVNNIQDDTQTTVTYKEKYDFDQEGLLEVTVVVTDEAGNAAEGKTQIQVLPEDKTAPIISSESSVTLQVGATFDPLESVEITDNQDPDPELTIVKNNLDTDKAGQYCITYEAKDRSGNKTTFTKEIQVVQRTTIGQPYPDDQNVVYLTFDDGPSYNTSKILDILDQYQVKATFFVTGTGQQYNDCILRAYKCGHTIGLHTYCHNYQKVYSSTKAYFDDLNQIGDMVESIIGKRPHYIRFPGGSSNTVSMNYQEGIMTKLSQEVIDRGYQYYDWNVSSSDASGNNVDVDKIIASATNADSGNLVILFHDASAKDTTVEALPKVIEYYQNLGFRFAAINDETYTCHHGINN